VSNKTANKINGKISIALAFQECFDIFLYRSLMSIMKRFWQNYRFLGFPMTKAYGKQALIICLVCFYFRVGVS